MTNSRVLHRGRRNWHKSQFWRGFSFGVKHCSMLRFRPNLVSGFSAKCPKLNSCWRRYLHFLFHPSNASREGIQEPCLSSVTIRSLTPALTTDVQNRTTVCPYSCRIMYVIKSFFYDDYQIRPMSQFRFWPKLATQFWFWFRHN